MDQHGHILQDNIMYKLIENYCTDPERILKLCEKYDHMFKIRDPKGDYFGSPENPGSIKQIKHWNMPTELKEAIFNTVPDEDDGFCTAHLNKYEAGDFLPKHKDTWQGYYKFKLVFLQADRPHFKYYDKNDKAHLVEEKPGALMDMHIATPHEVTPIGEDEKPKYSLALCWFPSSAGVA